ncbi:hypothetical protein MNBD_GAMMA09-1100 [hydrothermal vent metagenome]|uniref:Uncharacterized protein n=1 Tax=hydrothermal vent metagenome TaxID=652676 RepID=A0A3B0XP62_9ZZZZ
MNNSTQDTGVIEAILERLYKQRLPRLLALQEKVDNGTSLNAIDLEYLEHSIKDARSMKSLADRHPEYQSLLMKVIGLYTDITEKDLQIEKNRK